MRETYLTCLLLLLTLAALAQPPAADTVRLRRHLVALTTTPEPRNYQHPASLHPAADYIVAELAAAGGQPTEQAYAVRGQTYRNVLASFGPETGPRLIVGAHYDVCGEQPGADDNGTGVAALLELARLLGQQPALPYRIDLVAYTLEEPPFFRTKHMGSYVHAESLHAAGVVVRGIVALEMLGYYDNRKGSQRYPLALLNMMPGSIDNDTTVARSRATRRTFRLNPRRFFMG